MSLYGNSIIEAGMFNRELMEQIIFPSADEMRGVVERGGNDDLEGKKMITFFYEPSTRTRASFEIAMDYLGGKAIFSTENARIFSSVAKGETLEDTIKVLNGYHPDVIVLRSDEKGMAQRAANVSDVPIINAGDGIGEHPTQALLDVYTVQRELGRVDGISVVMIGDLKRGRTVHSFTRLLAKFKNVRMYFVSPKELRIGDDIKEYLKKHNVLFEEIDDLMSASDIYSADVFYQTRIQTERGGDWDGKDYYRFFSIDEEVLGLMKKNAIIMHPLPRNEELSQCIDGDRRATYFRQSENGLYIRMALLKLILEKPTNENCPAEELFASFNYFSRPLQVVPMVAKSETRH